MPHESTVEHEKFAKNYGPIENARFPTSFSACHTSHIPCTEEHELDDDHKKWSRDMDTWYERIEDGGISTFEYCRV